MKLLVSAYACAPEGAAEDRLGWNWVRALVRCGNYVHVITSGRNRAAIERSRLGRSYELTFHYCDLRGPLDALQRLPGMGFLHYLLWQWGAYRLARHLHEFEKFQRVHHITIGSCLRPSFLGRLGIPFVFGPVMGGGSTPANLRRGIRLRSRFREAMHDWSAAIVALNPLMRATFAHAKVIACATGDTLALIPKRFRAKCIVQAAAGVEEDEIAAAPQSHPPAARFLFVGTLRYESGLHLALSALARVRRELPHATLRVVGKGDGEDWLRNCAIADGVMSAVEWSSTTASGELAEAYRGSVALVSPGFHDSGSGVLQALAAGLPVICLDLGGPGEATTSDCACVVKTEHASEAAVVRSMAEAMILLATNPMLRARFSANALVRAHQLTWDRAARAVSASVELLNQNVW